jgi:cell division protein FtsB
MVENGADKPKIRSQIAFIGREVAALQADYASLAEAHTQSNADAAKIISDLKTQNQTVVAENQALVAENTKLKNPTPPPTPSWSSQPRIKGRMEH